MITDTTASRLVCVCVCVVSRDWTQLMRFVWQVLVIHTAISLAPSTSDFITAHVSEVRRTHWGEGPPQHSI